MAKSLDATKAPAVLIREIPSPCAVFDCLPDPVFQRLHQDQAASAEDSSTSASSSTRNDVDSLSLSSTPAGADRIRDKAAAADSDLCMALACTRASACASASSLERSIATRSLLNVAQATFPNGKAQLKLKSAMAHNDKTPPVARAPA
eukprot:CAMPEP_0169244652 /NCGR_PEP_ID=MMETSP1016-20121227/33761_1 /TAXON_ID=342587 /ORGANISM="Karlodinium micrum, Strain CCMP2283" /LENGTH=147 /DNA_ID=CAMNT_0009325071 /DNA_START=274 /DNA_END=716 /DNA_ORIENTATION=+